MAEFVAFDHKVEVIGAVVYAVQRGMERVNKETLGEQILGDYGLYPIHADRWYPKQLWLDAFREIASSTTDLVAIGMSIPDTAGFPPNIKTVEEALTLLNDAYQMNHRGGDIGGYYFEKTGERSGVMVCDNPYPSDFDYGLLYRVIQKYRSADSQQILVERDNTQGSRKTGGNACTFYLQW